MNGGDFGHGFATAGLSKIVGFGVDTLEVGDPLKIVIQSLAGGTVSAASGDGFANGAVSAALQFAFNQAMAAACDEMCQITGDYAEGPGKIVAEVKGVGDAGFAIADAAEPGLLDIIPGHKLAAGAALVFKAVGKLGGKSVVRGAKIIEKGLEYEARAIRELGAASIDQKIVTYGQRFDGLLEGNNASERVWLQMKTGGRMRSMLNEDWKSYFGAQAHAAKLSGGRYSVVSQALPDEMSAYFQKRNIGFIQVK